MYMLGADWGGARRDNDISLAQHAGHTFEARVLSLHPARLIKAVNASWSLYHARNPSRGWAGSVQFVDSQLPVSAE